jgi:hypothetical protein
MNGQTPYSIHTDVKFKPLELIDVQRLQAETKDQFLCRGRKVRNRY